MYSKELTKKIEKYYTRYYEDECCLKDYVLRAKNRINEEENELIKINDIQKTLGLNFEGQKHFVFGAGTGGLAVVLNKNFNCEVFGIEPDNDEFEIIQNKCSEVGIDKNNFKKEFGENLAFDDNQFDFVHCFTVLEHVQDVEKCIDEMIRITKPGGKIYINTPNYSFPYEGHYKIFFPTFLPKFIGYIFLIVLGKSPKFLKTINYITERSVNSILVRKKNIIWMRIYKPKNKINNSLLDYLYNWFIFKKFIYNKQEIVITKN